MFACLIHGLTERCLQPLIGAVDEELLSAHVTALLDKGLPSLLEAPPRIRELRLLYGLVGRVGGLGHLKAGLGAFVRRAGTALMVNQDRDKDMVEVRCLRRERRSELRGLGVARAHAPTRTRTHARTQVHICTRSHAPLNADSQFPFSLSRRCSSSCLGSSVRCVSWK